MAAHIQHNFKEKVDIKKFLKYQNTPENSKNKSNIQNQFLFFKEGNKNQNQEIKKFVASK